MQGTPCPIFLLYSKPFPSSRFSYFHSAETGLWMPPSYLCRPLSPTFPKVFNEEEKTLRNP